MKKSYRIIDVARPRLFATLMLVGMCSSVGFALGPGELFIANYNENSVTVYSRTASGAVVPRRTIRTGLTNPYGVLVDPLYGEVFVVNNTDGTQRIGSIQVYDMNANYPKDAPKRTIAGSATGLFGSTGLALDVLRNELYVANDDTSTITVFPRTAKGNVAPSRTIAGATTALNGPLSVTLDLLHNEIFVVNKLGAGRITVYPRTANGNVVPIRTIEGTLPGFNGPAGLALDLFRDEIVVANPFSYAVITFRRTDKGDVAPIRTLYGPSTGLCMPFDVIVDVVNNELVVANAGFTPITGCNQGTTVYPRTASGDATPKRSLDLGLPGGPPNPVTVAQTWLSWR